MFTKQDQIQGYDDALWAAIGKEEVRQEEHIELIASENYHQSSCYAGAGFCSD